MRPNSAKQAPRATRRTQESRRISIFIKERRVSESAMIAILGVSLALGIIGFAIHGLWVAAIVVLALGLGIVAANGRRDRIERASARQKLADLTH